MPDLDPLIQSQLAERRGVNAHVLVWIAARNRDTGATEEIGFWTGDDDQTFTIRAVQRLYHGAGAVIGIGAIRAGTGIARRTHTVRLPPMLEETRQALRGYEARQARVEVHMVPLSIDTGAPMAEPFRIIKGVLDGAPEQLGAMGGDSFTELKIVTGSRLSRGVAAFKSEAALQAVHPTDKGREYTALGTSWTVRWGQK